MMFSGLNVEGDFNISQHDEVMMSWNSHSSQKIQSLVHPSHHMWERKRQKGQC